MLQESYQNITINNPSKTKKILDFWHYRPIYICVGTAQGYKADWKTQ